MKKITLLLLAICATTTLFGVTIPKGVIYYDNSITQFETVRFSYGYRDIEETTLVTMTHQGDNIWSYNIPAAIEDVYRYIFLETELSDGIYDSTFPDFKDMIALDRGEVRTATTDKTICTGCTFVPVDNLEKNWYQGSWVKPSDDEDDTEKPVVPELPKATCNPHSATVPVFYLNTENQAPIESKEEYVNGSLYIDALDNEGYSSVGSASEPVITEVKGRGNYTWTGFEKKPYRIKMDAKASLLNMTKDKSYTLLAHADDNYGFLRNTVGFALSRFFELGYTPTAEPVELILNGEYKGLYFLTDHIKVSSNRVKIEEQDDLETDPEKITGGWLLEIDNYSDDPHITIYKKDEWYGTEYAQPMWFTYKSPEELSAQQETYITDFLNKANDAVYAEDKSSTEWEKYIDMDSLVNYYLVYEILANREGFHGSCYLHKERGENTKLIFGPVWDFGNALWNMNNTFIHEDWAYGVKWIDQIAKFPRFQAAVRERWLEKRGSLMPYLRAEVDAFIDKITMASQCDCKKWPEYGNENVLERKQAFYDIISARLAWLDTQFGTVDVTEEQALQLSVYPNPTEGNINIVSESAVSYVTLCDLSGKVLQTFDDASTTLLLNVQPGTYLLNVATDNGVQVRKVIVY